MADWDVVSEAPTAPTKGVVDDGWTVTGSDRFKFSPAAITDAQKKPNTTTVYMSPDKYLALTPELQSNPKTDKKGASLKASLDKGDDVDELPSLDVTVGKDGSAKVVDQDGRHRAQFAKDNGIDLIPVAVTRSGTKGDIKSVVGMRDVTAPVSWDFKPVEVAPKNGLTFDPLGDIGRVSGASIDALEHDASTAFPSAADAKAQIEANRAKYGLVGGAAKDIIVDPVMRTGNALRMIPDALGLPASLILGPLHATVGNALAAVMPSAPDVGIGDIVNDLKSRATGGKGTIQNLPMADPKESADAAIDAALAGIGPESMAGGVSGLTAAASRANALKTVARSAKTAVADANIKPGALQAREAGYVLPPASALEKPGIKNNLASGFGGKIKLQQGASAKNQEVTNQLATEDLGLPSDTPLTPQTFKRVRTKASQAYKAVANSVPEITVDPTYQNNIASLGGRNSAANSQFQGVMKNDALDELIQNISSVPKFPPDVGLEVVRKLRKDASANLNSFDDPSKAALGLAQRNAANEIDDLIERNLIAAGKSDLVPEYRNARQLLAKAHDIEGATNPVTGDVSAAAMGRLAARGRPLTGKSKVIADTANAFPKAMQNPEKFGGYEPYSALDAIAALTASVVTHNPAPLAAVFARPAVRSGLLSDINQNRMIPRPSSPTSPPMSPGLALVHSAPLPGVQNQLARGIFRAAQVNGLRALTSAQAMATPPQQGQ